MIGEAMTPGNSSSRKETPLKISPRLLVVTSTFPRWKNDKEPRFVYDLCRRLAARYEIHVLAPHTRGALRLEVMDGLTVHRFRYFPQRWQSLAYEGGILTKLQRTRLTLLQVPFFLLFLILALRRVLARLHFDVVHAHWILPQGLAAVAAQGGRPKVPVVCTSHGGDLFGLRGIHFDLLRRWVLRRSAAVTVVSRAMARELGPIAQKVPCRIIPMGTDLAATFTPDPKVPRHRATILFVGRLVEKKGVGYLIEAFGKVLSRFPESELWIVGSGPEEGRLKSLAASMAPVRAKAAPNDMEDLPVIPPSPGCVTFFGSIAHADLPHFYRVATLAAFPFVVAQTGDQEGFGLVLVEAAGCGCPVVASDLPAVRDIVIDGETGRLARPGDADHLSEKMIELLESPHFARNLAASGRRHVTMQFDWGKISDHYLSLFSNFVEEPLRGFAR